MVQEEGTNPQVGKVTVDEFAAKIKEKYPEYKDVDNLKLAQSIVEKYPEYKEVVTFEAIEPVKKKDGNITSASLDGESPSFLSQTNTFFQPTYDAADWVNKNIPVWSNWASVSTQLAGGITKAVDGLIKEATLNFMPDSEYKESIKKQIKEKGINEVLDTPIELIADNLSLYGEEIKQKRLENYGVDLEEQQLGILKNISSGNLSAAAAIAVDGATDGIIQSGLAALTGVAPLAVSAGGEKYYDVSNKPNYSSSERLLYSSAVGLMEGLIESVFATDIKAFGKILDSDLYLKGFEKELIAAAKNTPWYKEFLKMGTEEGLEESLSESFGQMLTGFKEGTRPDPIAIAEAFVMGFLPGAGTHVITNGISAIGSEQRTKRRQELAKRIEETKVKAQDVEDQSQKAILEEMAKSDIDELNKEISLDAELYAGFSEEDVNKIQSINTDIRNLYQKVGLAVDEDQKNTYKKQILDARSEKLEIENRYSEEPIRYIRDGRLVTKAQFVDMVNKATPEEISTGQWGVENDTEVEQLLASRIPKVDTKEEAAVPSTEVVETEVLENLNEIDLGENETIIENREVIVKGEKVNFTIIEQTSEKDGVKTTKYQSNRSNKSSDQRSNSSVSPETVLNENEEINLEENGLEDIDGSSTEVTKVFEVREDANGTKVAVVEFMVTYEDGTTDFVRGTVKIKQKAKEAAVKKPVKGKKTEKAPTVKTPVEAVVEQPKKTPSIPLDADIQIQDIIEVKDSEGNPRLFARYPLKDKPIKSFFEIKQEKDGTVKRVSDKSYGPVVKTLKKRLAKEVPSSKVKEQLSKETKTEELEIILLDEQGARKKLTQTALSDPRNIQKGKMTVEYSDKGLTFKTKSDTGRMKENGGELFVSNKEIESIPNINKYEKGTKEYAFQVAGVIGVADQYKGDPIKLMKDSFVKPQNIGKEGTPSAKRFTPAQGEKLSNMVGNFNRIIKRIGASPVKIVFVNSPAEFKQYYEYTTGSKKETLSKASYLPLQKEIIVDLSKADMTTLAHEMLHAYVSAVKLDRKKVTLFTGIIEAELLKGSDAEVKLAKELSDFRNEYIKQDVYGKGRTKEDAIIAEEFLAEYVGMMSAYTDQLSPAKQVSFSDKIRAAVVKFLAKIGVVDKSLTVKIQNREDALNFINGFVDALQGRTEVTAAPEVQESEPIAREQIDAVNIISADTPKQKAKKEAVAEVLNGFAESQLVPNSSEQDLVSRFLNNIFEESLYTLKKGPRESGMTWYIEDITEFENKMTVLLPELADPNQMKLFKQVLAITSSGTNPNQNLQTAYTLWIRSNGATVNFAKNWGEDKISFITNKGVPLGTGIVVRETKAKYIVQKVNALGDLETFKNGQPKLFEAKKSTLKEGYPKPAGFTARGSIVAQQLSKIEQVYKDVNGDINKLIEFFEKPQPVSELRKYNKGLPDVDGNVRKQAVGKRNGAFIFGEKIGAFYQNMIGIGDTITMDLWWSRTWNRYMGTMLSTVDNKQVIQETPRTDRERDIMRKAITLAANKLGLDVSELQAVIWYFEQELWTKAGNVSPSFSYVTAVESLNSKIEADEQTQKRFSEAGADLTAAEKRRQDAIARANNIIAEGGIQGDIARDQIDWQPSLFGKGQVNPAIVSRNIFVEEAAIDLLRGKITNADFQEISRITQAIDPITQFFLPASIKDIQAALDKNKIKLIAVSLKDGQEVGLRLDIPAYKNRNIWVVSIHEKGKSGKPISYGSVAWATDVVFGSNPKVAAFIASGQNMDTLKKQDKTTIARMLGKWKNFEGKTKEEKDASAVKKVDEIVAIENSYPGTSRKGSPWRQIGMNPFRHSFFYDRRTGQPVIAAAEVVQIGGLVYAKDVVYADKNDPIFNVEGYKDANGETVRFQIEDQASEEKNNKQTYEAVERNSEGLFDADVDAAVDGDVSEMDSWQERPRTMFERFIDLTRLKIQDKFRKIIAVQEDIEFSNGSPVGLDQDFRNAETLMHGKAKEELNKTEIIVGKIASLVKASGLSVEKFNDLLYSMHAQERNRYLRVISTDTGKSLMAMRKKKGMKTSEVAELLGISTQDYIDIEANKTALKTSDLADVLLIYGTTPSRFFYDNAKVKDGSGMTDVEARKILSEYGLDLTSPDVSQLKPRIADAVQAIRDLTANTRNRLIESGLETQATIDAFNATYKNYVPLRGFADGNLQSEMIEGGRKLEVRGREKRAKGRSSKADSPLTQVIISNTTTIVRAEKNNVMNKFFSLAVSNPNKDVYEIVDSKVTKEYKREIRNGKIVTTAKTIADYMSDPNMVSVRVGGEYKFIRFKDASLADALKGANVVKAEWMTKYLGAFNRALSSFITTYDPEFILRNFSRDIQTAVLNLFSEQEMTEGLIKDKSIVAKVVKDVWPAIRSIGYVESGKPSSNKEMDQYYREFKEDGAKTEWFYSKSSTEVEKDIKNLIEGKKDTALQAAGNFVERMNSAVENGVRLSAYVNARKAGISRDKAAELAKNLTVNFNKSGEWGQIGNTLFLFFNASVQGTSRLMRTLKPQYKVDSEGNRSLHINTAQKMAIGLSLMGSIMSIINEGLSDDDEDDESFYSKIPDFEKERNIIIMKPNGKGYWKIPLPYGVNVFYVTGTLLADASQKIKTPGEVAGGIMQAALGSFSPINFPNSDDTSKFLVKFVMPTIGQVPLSLAVNENYFGQTVYNENFPFDTSPKPESELGRKGGNLWTKELTRVLNKISGGSEFRSGSIDINPDTIDFVMESYSGGMGKFLSRSANTVEKIITGNWDEIEPRKVPFLRVFYGQSPKYANVQDFYSRSILVNQMQEEVKARIISGPEAKRVSKVFYLGKNIRKQLSKLKKREDAVMQIKDADTRKEKMKKLEELRYKLVADYNKQYERFEIDKLK